MPKFTINKASVTAAMKAHKLSYHYVANKCGLTYNEFYNVMYHNSCMVREKTYDAFCKFFIFNDFGHVVKIPHIERLEAIRQERKEKLLLEIRKSERRKLIKSALNTVLYAIMVGIIIWFARNDILVWLNE